MFGPLSLQNVKPLAQGSRRYVFQHPTETGLLVKVLKREWSPEIPLGVAGLQIRRPNEMVRSFHREISEFLRARSKIAEGPLPIARVYGIAETSLGTGLIVERISAGDGSLAPSLKKYVLDRGLDEALERSLIELRNELSRIDTVAGDINTNNIVVGADADGVRRLVLVDGIGDNNFVPINSLSSFMNRRTHRRRFARLIARLRELDSRRL